MKFLSLIMLLMPITLLAQNATITKFSFERTAVVNMSEDTEDWDIHVQHLEAPEPGSNSLRAQLLEKKKRIMQAYPATGVSPIRRGSVPTPIVGHNFEGNNFNGVPNDNDMAISNDSLIISVTNSRIHTYNAVTGEQIRYRSLSNLAYPLSVSGSKFDPKVVYDPISDRFIIAYLNGSTWGTSWIIVGFSQTNDPSADWNMYKIYGNPLDNETWSDYPVIGISENDLFIGINTFTNGSTNNSGFTESCLWQIGLNEGYAGAELITNYYSDILEGNKEIFNITPISGGVAPYGPNMYLLSNIATAMQNDTVFLLEVTGSVADVNTQLNVSVLHADENYILPVPAKQGNGNWFDTNDNRVLGGYYHHGSIHFVQSCTAPNTGRSGIFYGVIDDPTSSTPLITTRIISELGVYYGYPNISCSAVSTWDEQSILTFNHSGENTFPGLSAIYMTGDLQASDRVLVKEGLNNINVMGDTIERWGDYTGAQPLYDDLGTIWAVGSFGNNSGGHGTWITEITTPDKSALNIEHTSLENSTKLYPNPFDEQITVEFELESSSFIRLELYDMQGKLVRLLQEDRIKSGKNRLTFNGAFLSVGTYILKGSADNSIVFSKQLQKH